MDQEIEKNIKQLAGNITRGPSLISYTYQTPERKLVIGKIYIYEACKRWFIQPSAQRGTDHDTYAKERKIKTKSTMSPQTMHFDYVEREAYKPNLDASEHKRTTCLFGALKTLKKTGVNSSNLFEANVKSPNGPTPPSTFEPF